jgi:hypothetical protein
MILALSARPLGNVHSIQVKSITQSMGSILPASSAIFPWKKALDVVISRWL